MENTVVTQINLEKVLQLENDVVDMDLDTFRSELSKLTLEELVAMGQRANTSLWEDIKHPNIRKMRMIMEVKAAYFPEEAPLPHRRVQSPWKTIPTEKLLQAVKDKGLTYSESYHEGIRRMRLIMAIKAAGLTPEYFK